ncbi:hypothetical protein [Clostridium brassicae]
MEEYLRSDNVLIKILVIFDRRVEKRTFTNMKNTISNDEDIV